MRRFLRLLLWLVVFLGLPHGCVSPEASRPSAASLELDEDLQALAHRAATAKVTDLFLWRVEKDGKTSWMLGTIHVGVPLGKIPRHVVTQLSEAQRVAIESDPSQTHKEGGPVDKLLRRERDAMTLPNDQSLARELSSEAFEKLVADTGLPAEFLDGLKPYAAKFFYEFMALLQAVRYVPEGSLDLEVLARAREEGKDVRFLETAEEVEASLAQVLGYDNSKQVTFDQLNDFLLQEAELFKRDLLLSLYHLILAYKSGDLKAIERQAAESLNAMPGFQEDLVNARNRLWLPRLEKLFAEGDAFVAVGVLHMTGPSSLTRLLEADGYKVTRQRAPL